MIFKIVAFTRRCLSKPNKKVGRYFEKKKEKEKSSAPEFQPGSSAWYPWGRSGQEVTSKPGTLLTTVVTQLLLLIDSELIITVGHTYDLGIVAIHLFNEKEIGAEEMD